MQSSRRRLVALAALTSLAAVGAALASSACVGDDPAAAVPGDDGAAVDAQPAIEAPDASVVDAAPSSFCQKQGNHDLCADFDQPVDLGSVFTIAEVVGTGTTPVRVPDAGTPAPVGAMRAVLQRGMTGAGYNAARWSFQTLYQAGGSTRPAVRISADLFVARADTAGVYVLSLEDPAFRIYLQPLDGGPDLGVVVVRSDGTPLETTELTALRVPIGQWTKVAVNVAQRSGDPTTAGLTLSVGSSSQSILLVSSRLPQAFRADFGLATSSNASVDWTVDYDNVVVDYK